MKTIILSLNFILAAHLLSAQYFTESTDSNLEGAELSAAAFADVDGDNDLDVLITGFFDDTLPIAPKSKLYINDGSGQFTEMVNTTLENIGIGSIAFSDIDGDDDQDLFLAGYSVNGDISILYNNDGQGNFTEIANTPFLDVHYGSAKFADVDNDGDPDLLLTGTDSLNISNAKLYTNEEGIFTEVADTPFFGSSQGSISFADIDGNTFPDVIITGKSITNGITQLYTNQEGIFSENNFSLFEQVHRSSSSFADVDGDNDPDLLITGLNNSSDQIAKLYINQNGVFNQDTTNNFVGVEHGSTAFADVDGDEDTDLLIAGFNEQIGFTAKLYINDGFGQFTVMPDTPFSGIENGSANFADVDGDSDSDLLLTGQGFDSNNPVGILYINTFITSLKTIDKVLSFDFTLYPNPSVIDKLNVSYTSDSHHSLHVRIYDLQGGLMLQQNKHSESGRQHFSINISSLRQGSYMLQLMDGERVGSRLFIVE